MHLELFLAFVAATTILMLIPGPNVALIVANSVAYGQRFGLLTVAGTSSAMVIQLALTGLGLGELLGSLGHVFAWLRCAGVIYLLYLGIKQWRAEPVDLTQTRPQQKSVQAIYWRGFLVSLTNPKTLLFYGAFFPQFLVAGHNVGGQIMLLSATFLLLAILLDGTWAIAAARLRTFLSRRGRLRNRAAGGMLMGAAVGLAMARRR
jgi:homoserine/homoserine lactone efflux protein